MTIEEIKQLIHDEVDTNSTTFPEARMVRGINKAKDILWNIILENDSLNQFDDNNYNDLNEGYFNISNGVASYNLTEDENFADLLYVVKVLSKDENGAYQELSKIGANDDRAEGQLKETSTGSPSYYRMSGKTAILSPVPAYSSLNGGKVLFIRKPEDITVNDTTKELSIPATFHFLVALKVAYDYARAKRLDNRNDILNEINLEEQRLGIHVSSQDKDTNVVMTPLYEDPR